MVYYNNKIVMNHNYLKIIPIKVDFFKSSEYIL